MALGVAVGVGVGVGVGPNCAQYLAPVLFAPKPSPKKTAPPHTIISVPVQTAVWSARGVGAFVVFVAIQLSVLELYLPPVSKLT